MARGGKREGSGRKVGAATIRAQETALKAIAGGITPLEVMLQTMRRAWDEQDVELAMTAAKDAAPYVHPKLAPIDAKTGETAKFVIVNPCN